MMYDIIDAVEPYMPADKPRYLMGVGTPSNIIEGVARGVDFFDCVMPARNARHAKLFTWSGAMNIRNEKYKTDERPIDPDCDCSVCRNFSRAYLRHLFVAEEMLAMRLAVMHNLYFYKQAGPAHPGRPGRRPVWGLPGGIFGEAGRAGSKTNCE